jgi:hypothetical protein
MSYGLGRWKSVLDEYELHFAQWKPSVHICCAPSACIAFKCARCYTQVGQCLGCAVPDTIFKRVGLGSKAFKSCLRCRVKKHSDYPPSPDTVGSWQVLDSNQYMDWYDAQHVDGHALRLGSAWKDPTVSHICMSIGCYCSPRHEARRNLHLTLRLWGQCHRRSPDMFHHTRLRWVLHRRSMMSGADAWESRVVCLDASLAPKLNLALMALSTSCAFSHLPSLPRCLSVLRRTRPP